ncbi:MAG: FumA C-terminus/TtdB family hydratase beta subunit [Thermodesulfobacteriota bacterium]|nr:FumA C-terminus/TtdB family hydratase beta subunit [Thermodesulfobacteriota bacterium]
MNTSFTYQPMFPMGKDDTPYRQLTDDHVAVDTFNGAPVTIVQPAGLTLLAETAFSEVAHRLRPSHLAKTAAILDDPQSSDNDRYVALEMIKNAVIASGFVFPLCQDTGTAVVIGKKGQGIWTGADDEETLSRGVFNAYTTGNLRYSQVAPRTMYEEVNTGTNLPAQIELYAVPGNAYSFLFIAKGGGSANKTFLFQKTKAILNPDALLAFLSEEIRHLGTAACPPYHLAVVVGGTSAEANLKTVKLASAGYLDGLPDTGSNTGHAFRDRELEAALFKAAADTGIGAQFGGKYLCYDVRVIRMPRHGASCPVGLGLSCSADRNIKAKITESGIYIEQLETDPARYLPEVQGDIQEAVPVDLNQPMAQIQQTLTRLPVATRLLLSGKIVVARDIAHAKIKEAVDNGDPMPGYMRDHIILYAGPAKTPAGYPSGSFGPTTSARMDPYIPVFQEQGASLVTLGKGNRSQSVVQSCKTHGGFYLGTIGGVAATFGKECITHVETVDYPELGMEAVRLITVKDFPAVIITDDKGNDFFDQLG